LGRCCDHSNIGQWIRFGGCKPRISLQKKGQDILAYYYLAPRDRLELPTKWLTATGLIFTWISFKIP